MNNKFANSDRGTSYNYNSPYVRLKNINIEDCQWTTGFWGDKFELVKQKMLPYMTSVLCGDIGHALNNFKIVAGEKKGEHKGMYWHDGDFYKFMEAKVYVYALTKEKQLLEDLDEYIRIIGKAQEEDGYIQTQIQLREGVFRFENRKYHEMYNIGHLLISACLHYRITKKQNFLNIAVKQADLLYALFMPETKHYCRFGFNQTQIMGLVELYRTTGNEKYLKLAEKFINNRGKSKVEHHTTTEGYPIGDMVQERTPLRESTEAVGHAVLALYYYAGAADVYSETGEKKLISALKKLWDNVTKKKMYVTGAVGQAHYGASTNLDMIEEGFIDEYMLPNLTAYNETCANLCNAMFSQRMLNIYGESKYADIIELVLYNSGLSGISIDGEAYFYANPLRMLNNTRDYCAHDNVTETPNREGYLDCFCCPPNLVRTIAKLTGWAYSLSENGIAVNLYGSNSLITKLPDGTTLKLKQETDYPWDGKIKFTIEECTNDPFEIKLRIPNWSVNAIIHINKDRVNVPIISGEFHNIIRSWREGDTITLDLPMKIRLIEGHKRIEEIKNQIAIKRGPIVYCLESPDLPKDTDILNVYIKSRNELKAVHHSNLLGGVTTIEGEVLIRSDVDKTLYKEVGKTQWHNQKVRFVPYFAWSNRGQAEMSVFFPVVWDLKEKS